VWAYLAGPIFTLLPRRWRQRVMNESPGLTARCAVISGILEWGVSLGVLVLWHVTYFSLLANQYFENAYRSDHGVSYTWGTVKQAGVIAFVFHPVTCVIFYFMAEGVLRAIAAYSSDVVYGTLPLAVVEFAIRKWKPVEKRPVLPLVADEITPGGAQCDMKVASCREKPDWKYPFTIHYFGGYFQVIGAVDLGVGSRPFVYSLRRLPPGEIAKGLKNSDPEEILVAAQ
jgi:hypothetical protein